ncbi:MAG: hypothetical protein ABJC12_07385 [Saprospiraceae bacterium]
MRSLHLEYNRMDQVNDILADLFDLQQVDMKIDLPVLSSDTTGIELKFPNWLTGIFYLKVQDGEQSFLKRVSIQ